MGTIKPVPSKRGAVCNPRKHYMLCTSVSLGSSWPEEWPSTKRMGEIPGHGLLSLFHGLEAGSQLNS